MNPGHKDYDSSALTPELIRHCIYNRRIYGLLVCHQRLDVLSSCGRINMGVRANCQASDLFFLKKNENYQSGQIWVEHMQQIF